GRRYDAKAGSFSAEQRLTDQPGPDAEAVLATVGDGTVWMAWQAWTAGQADILLAPLGPPGAALGRVELRHTPSKEWAAGIAGDKSGRVHVAFDSYQTGHYDVMLRTRQPDGTLGATITVGGWAIYQARPSVAVDPRGRVWVAYEERTPDWGKDAVNLVDGKGSS